MSMKKETPRMPKISRTPKKTEVAEIAPDAAPPGEPPAVKFETVREFVDEVQEMEASYGQLRGVIAELKLKIAMAKKESDQATYRLMQFISAGPMGRAEKVYIAALNEKYREVALADDKLNELQGEQKYRKQEAEEILGNLRDRIRQGINPQGFIPFDAPAGDEYTDGKSAAVKG